MEFWVCKYQESQENSRFRSHTTNNLMAIHCPSSIERWRLQPNTRFHSAQFLSIVFDLFRLSWLDEPPPPVGTNLKIHSKVSQTSYGIHLLPILPNPILYSQTLLYILYSIDALLSFNWDLKARHRVIQMGPCVICHGVPCSAQSIRRYPRRSLQLGHFLEYSLSWMQSVWKCSRGLCG
jgi:hypothetical protein